MALQWTTLELPLGGADKYTDAPHVQPGKLEEARNVRFREPPKLSKRYGSIAVGLNVQPSGSIPEIARMDAAGARTVCYDSRGVCFSRDETKGDLGFWAVTGAASNVHTATRGVYRRPDLSLNLYDCAVNGDVMVYVWVDLTGTRFTVHDLQSGTVVMPYGQFGIGTAFNPRCIAVGAYIYVFCPTGVGTIVAYKLDTTAAPYTFTGPITLPFTRTPDIGLWDVAPLSGSTQYLVAYASNAAQQVTVDQFEPVTDTLTAGYAGTEVVVSAIGVEGTDGELVYTAYDIAAGSIKALTLNTATMALNAGPYLTGMGAGGIPNQGTIGIARINGSERMCVFNYAQASPKRSGINYQRLGASLSAGTARTVEDIVCHSKPFNADGRVNVVVAYDDVVYDPAGAGSLVNDQSKQPTYFIAELTDDAGTEIGARWIGTMERGLASPVSQTKLTHVSADSNGKFYTGISTRYRVAFSGDDDSPTLLVRSGLSIASMDFLTPQRFQGVEWGDSHIIAGSKPSQYSAASTHEIGFAWYPENYALNSPLGYTAGGQLEDGRYHYVLVYEWEDSAGNIHRSAPSEIRFFDQAHGTNFQYHDIVLRETLWSTQSNVRVIPYRTQKDAGANSIFYRDSTLGFAANYGTIINIGVEFCDAAHPTLTSFITLKEILYTTGDILDNAGLPPCTHVENHADRLWLVNDQHLYFSQPYVEGEAPRFNEGLRLNVQANAAKSLDSNLIAFTDREILAISGEGPPATGGLDVGFNVSTVSTDTGCLEPRSIVVTPRGIMFQGSKGIYLLSRGLQLEYVGAPIKRWLETYPTVTSAVVAPDTTQVLISCDDGENGVRLVYDYALDAWSLDELYAPQNSAAVVWNGASEKWVYGWSTVSYVHRETPNVWVDNGTAVPWSMVTPWIKLNTLQSWQFCSDVVILGDFTNCHSFTVEVGYDYDAAYLTTYTVSPTVIAGLTRDQVKLTLEKWDCEAVRFRITETFDTEGGNNAGPDVRSIVLRVGAEADPFRIEDAARL